MPFSLAVVARFYFEEPATPMLRAHSRIASHLERRCIPTGCVAKTLNIHIFQFFNTLAAGHHNAQNCELNFS
jgi:hypothetical protein